MDLPSAINTDMILALVPVVCAIISMVIPPMDFDRRRKSLARDIEIFNGWKNNGDPAVLLRLKHRTDRQLEREFLDDAATSWILWRLYPDVALTELACLTLGFLIASAIGIAVSAFALIFVVICFDFCLETAREEARLRERVNAIFRYGK